MKNNFLKFTLLCMIIMFCSGANYYRMLLTLPRVTSTYQTDPYAANLIARWDFEDGLTTNDTSGNSQNMTTGGGTGTINVIVGTNIYGRVENGWYFPRNVAQDYIARAFTASDRVLWSNNNVIVSMWIKRFGTMSTWHWMGTQGNINDGVQISDGGVSGGFARGSFRIRSNATDVANAVITGYNIQTQDWSFVLISYNTNGVYSYVDGVLSGSNITAGATYGYDDVFNKTNAAMGFSLASSYGAAGTVSKMYIDNVKVYTGIIFSAISGQAVWLYNNTNPTNCMEAR